MVLSLSLEPLAAVPALRLAEGLFGKYRSRNRHTVHYMLDYIHQAAAHTLLHTDHTLVVRIDHIAERLRRTGKVDLGRRMRPQV